MKDSDKGVQFEGPQSVWRGPAVEFAREASLFGQFKINITTPPEFLHNRSLALLGSSSFDYCVYATALGYLDFCVAKFTVTDERALIANWFILDNSPLYLIVNQDGSRTEKGLQEFADRFLTIFRPFSGGVWMMIMFVFLPFLGILIALQEHGVEGSDYPSKEKIIRVNENDMQPEEVVVKYPMRKNLNRGLYLTLHSYLRQGYGSPVKTYGASWTVLAFCFIGMLGTSLYISKMASFLTSAALKPKVESLEDAIKAGYRFCKCILYACMYPCMNICLYIDRIVMCDDAVPTLSMISCTDKMLHSMSTRW